MSTPPDFTTRAGCQALRQALRQSLPTETFEPVPARGVASLALVPVYVALMVPIAADWLPAWADLLLALVIGQLVTSVGLAAHETLHRATFRSRFWMQVHGWVGFAWWCFGPGLWHAWHVQAHHGRTQAGEADPDALMTLDHVDDSWLTRFVHAVTPGSGHPISWVSPTFLFTMQGQLFLWHFADQPAFSKIRMDRWRERGISVAIVAGWLALATWLGGWAAVCCIAIPMATSNATLMMYIATNHWVRPLTPDHNNPFVNTTSVSVPAAVDLLHVSFSYHQEHHVFPSMSPRYARQLRARLRELAPDAVQVHPLGAVLRQIYLTPALYLDPDTLVDPHGSVTVPIAEVDARLTPDPGALGQPTAA